MAEVIQHTMIWLANSGSRPVEVAENQVVAMAERVSESKCLEQKDDSTDTDEVNRLV